MAINRTHRGFTLLISLIFMSVMLAFGLLLSSLAYKQQTLASDAVASQYAFYAADAGIECVSYFDSQKALFAWPSSNPGIAPTIASDGTALTCDGQPPVVQATVSPVITTWTPSMWALAYRFNLDSSTRCVDVTVYKYSPPLASGVSTYLFSQGYNVPCTSVGTNLRMVTRGINVHY